MHSFDDNYDCLQQYPPFHLRGQDVRRNGDADFEEVLQYAETGIRRVDSADISTISSMYNGKKGSNVSVQLEGFPNNLETASSGFTVEKGQFMLHKGVLMVSSGSGGGAVGNSYQNTERDEACLQQFENIHQSLIEPHQVLGSEQQQVASGYLGHSIGGRGAGAFEVAHARWRGQHQRLINDLRSALSYNRNDKVLNLLVGAVVSHYDELFIRIKKAGVRSDMFHILSGVWRTPAERCLMWLGGFRPSDLLKVVEKDIQPLSEDELVGICHLQLSCQQTEDALSQGMDNLHNSLFLSLSLSHHSSPNLINYANQMATAITNMEKIGDFLNQADLLRLQTLQQLQRILTAHQAARALIAINDYESRLRALSSLWNNWVNVNVN